MIEILISSCLSPSFPTKKTIVVVKGQPGRKCGWVWWDRVLKKFVHTKRGFIDGLLMTAWCRVIFLASLTHSVQDSERTTYSHKKGKQQAKK